MSIIELQSDTKQSLGMGAACSSTDSHVHGLFDIAQRLPPRQPSRAAACFRRGVAVALVAVVAGCGPTYSPNTYSGAAVQQANKVEQGVVVGVREVAVSVTGGVGAISGAAAGGITGAQVGTGAISALSALGGSLLGGVVGATAEKVTSDTRAFEYIVRKPNAELVSVTQKDEKPLEIGARVLVIAGAQARIVPDYTVHPEVATAPAVRPSSNTEAAATVPVSSDAPSAGPAGDAPPTPAPLTPPVASASADPLSDPAKPAP
jgi:outer membrane lipoprotein SlyB